MKMLRPKDKTCEFRFLYYVMQTIKYSPVDHTRMDRKISKIYNSRAAD